MILHLTVKLLPPHDEAMLDQIEQTVFTGETVQITVCQGIQAELEILGFGNIQRKET